MSSARRRFERITGRGTEQFADMPGPDPLPWLGNVREIGKAKHPWRLFDRWVENHGGILVFWKFHQPIVLLSDPALIAEVLIDHELKYFKDKPIPQLGPILTVSSLVSNRQEAPTATRVGDYERADRKSPLTVVRSKLESGVPWLDAQVAPIAEVVRRTIENLEAESKGIERFDLLEAMRRLTWDSLSKLAVGRVFDDERDRYADFWTLVGYGDERLRATFSMPEASQEFRDAFVRWTATFDSLVNGARLREPSEHIDLLSFAVRSGNKLPDRDLAWEIGNVWFGGQMGIASTLVSTQYFLARNPRVRAELQAEVRERFGGREFTWAELKELPLLDAVIRESQRLVPPVPLFFRRSSQFEAVTLGDYTLPPNTEILMSSWGLQRDPSYWEAPEHFRPERWLEPGFREANPYGSGHFFPFGRGPRACAGWGIALFVSKVVLAGLMRSTTLHIDDPFAFDEELFATVLSLTWLQARAGDPAP